MKFNDDERFLSCQIHLVNYMHVYLVPKQPQTPLYVNSEHVFAYH